MKKNSSNKITTEDEVVKEEIATTVPEDVIDVKFDSLKKKRFRIDGDNNRILELDTSDLSVINRIEDSYPKLIKLEQKASLLKVSTDDEAEKTDVNIAKTLREIDTEMRDIMDYIFDANVSVTCAPSGSMFDLFNGEFRYEHILDTLTKLYETNLDKEYELLRKRINKHTDKYIRK